MGGRGGSSGINRGEEGFQYKRGNKIITVQRNSAGVTLVDGKASPVNYSKLKQAAAVKDGYKVLSSKDIKILREERAKDYNSHDYELLENTRGKKKSVWRSKRR